MATAKDKRAAARAALASLDLAAGGPIPAMSSGPKTGPGHFLSGVTGKSELEEENRQLKAQLASWDGDGHARLIDPGLIVESRWANRHPLAFQSAEFADLRAEIKAAGGNVQPVKVRALASGRYELVFGHRRVQACRELGLPVLAVIADSMTDVDLFVEMDRENRQRADLSPWEQGVMYRRALDEGLFPSQRKLAEQLGVDVSNAGKSLALAGLPAVVVEAFDSPLQIQLRWGGKLAKAVESDPDGVLARAAEMSSRLLKPKAAEVFAFLVNGSQSGSSSEPPPSAVNVKVKSDGSAVIKLPTGSIEPSRQAALAKLIADFVAKR